MNGGTSSTLPARRPVSFHSLHEHQRNGPGYLPPHPHRRPRTPRSSPLAGPSVSSDHLNSEGKDGQGNQKPRYRPNRISSIPDMVDSTQSLYGPDTAFLSRPSSTPSFTTLIGIPSAVPFPYTRSSSSEDDKEKELCKDDESGNSLYNIAKRLSIISGTSSFTTNEKGDDNKTNRRRSTSFFLQSASMTSLASTSTSTSSSRTVRTDKTSHTAPPIPTIPRWALDAMREEAANPDRKYFRRRGTSEDLASSSLSPPLPNQSTPRPPSMSHDPVESWMSAAGEIPTFSRSGLRRDAVVMPVKKGSLAEMKSASSIRTTRSVATLSQPAGARGDSGVMTKTESSPAMDSNATGTRLHLIEEDRPRRHSMGSPLKSKVSKVVTPSLNGSENVPPLPSLALNDSVPSVTRRPTSPFSTVTFNLERKNATSRRNSVVTIDESRLPFSSPNDTRTEFGRMTADVTTDDVKSQDTQAAKMKRKSIRQIFMRITTAGEKVKSTTIHDPPPASVMISSDTLMSLDLPPSARFERQAGASVQSLPFTKQTPELSCNRGDPRSGKRFKGIRRRWKSVLATVRG